VTRPLAVILTILAILAQSAGCLSISSMAVYLEPHCQGHDHEPHGHERHLHLGAADCHHGPGFQGDRVHNHGEETPTHVHFCKVDAAASTWRAHGAARVRLAPAAFGACPAASALPAWTVGTLAARPLLERGSTGPPISLRVTKLRI